jgi:hypothetical protein
VAQYSCATGENAGRKVTNLKNQWREWFSLILIPVGLFVWFFYRAFYLHDMQVNLVNFQGFLYSTAISPSANKVVPMQEFIWPWLALKNTLNKLITQPISISG